MSVFVRRGGNSKLTTPIKLSTLNKQFKLFEFVRKPKLFVLWVPVKFRYKTRCPVPGGAQTFIKKKEKKRIAFSRKTSFIFSKKNEKKTSARSPRSPVVCVRHEAPKSRSFYFRPTRVHPRSPRHDRGCSQRRHFNCPVF